MGKKALKLMLANTLERLNFKKFIRDMAFLFDDIEIAG
jgi:hypothetical protein